jgi:hypothetical protein
MVVDGIKSWGAVRSDVVGSQREETVDESFLERLLLEMN